MFSNFLQVVGVVSIGVGILLAFVLMYGIIMLATKGRKGKHDPERIAAVAALIDRRAQPEIYERVVNRAHLVTNQMLLNQLMSLADSSRRVAHELTIAEIHRSESWGLMSLVWWYDTTRHRRHLRQLETRVAVISMAIEMKGVPEGTQYLIK